MKSLTFNQLQLRVIASLLYIFCEWVVGHRYCIGPPQIEPSLSFLPGR
jgi:hypothetical protein